MLKTEYPFLWIDAVYEKVRFFGMGEVGGGDNRDIKGSREVLALEPDFSYKCAGVNLPGDKADKLGGRNVPVS